MSIEDNNDQIPSSGPSGADTTAGQQQSAELVCQAEDLKDLLQQIARQITQSDQRHSESLQDMHERLALIGSQAQRAKSNVPLEFQPAFDRIEDAVGVLADRISRADYDRQSRLGPTPADVETATQTAQNERFERELNELKASVAATNVRTEETAELALAAAAAVDDEGYGTAAAIEDDAAPVDDNAPETPVVDTDVPEFVTPVEAAPTWVQADPAEPWDENSASALVDLYDSGEPGLPPLPETVQPVAQGDDTASQEIAETQTGSIQVEQMDRAWLEARFADVAARVEMSLADIQPDNSLEEFGRRFDQLEIGIAEALQDVMAKQNVDGLRHVEDQLAELTRHLELTQTQLAKLDGIEDQIGVVVETLSQERSIPVVAMPGKKEISDIADAVSRKVAVDIGNREASDGSSRQITDLQDMFTSYMSERREGEENTSGALDTMQAALVHLLERVDAMETAQPASPAMQFASSATASAPQEYVRESVRFKVDEASHDAAHDAEAQVAAVDPGQQEIEKSAEMAHAVAAVAATHQVPRGSLAEAGGEAQAMPASVAPASKAPLPTHAEKADFIAQARRAQQLAAEKSDALSLKEELPSGRPAAKKIKDAGADLLPSGVQKAASVPRKKSAGKGLSKPLLLACAGLAVVTMGTLLYGKMSNGMRPTAKVIQKLQAPRTAKAGAAEESRPVERKTSIPTGQEGSDADQMQQLEMSRPVEESSLSTQQVSPPNALPGISMHQGTTKRTAAFLEQLHNRQKMAKRSTTIAAQGGTAAAVAKPIALQMPATTGSAISQGVSDGTSVSVRALDMPPALLGPLSLRLAAAKGDPSAEFEVAARFAEGKGIKQDFSQAVTWYSRSASRGFAPAQYRLGTLYERGLGVNTDLPRARIWYQRAAKKGNVKAMHNLAVLSAGQQGSGPDYVTAAQWFTEAGERGLADSQFNLGILHNNGLGVKRDLVAAFKWFSLAANNGDKQASARRNALRSKLAPAELANAERQVRSWRPAPVERMVNDPRAAGQAWQSHGNRRGSNAG